MAKSITATVRGMKMDANLDSAKATRDFNAAQEALTKASRKAEYHRRRGELVQVLHEVSSDIDALDAEYKDVK